MQHILLSEEVRVADIQLSDHRETEGRPSLLFALARCSYIEEAKCPASGYGASHMQLLVHPLAGRYSSEHGDNFGVSRILYDRRSELPNIAYLDDARQAHARLLLKRGQV